MRYGLCEWGYWVYHARRVNTSYVWVHILNFVMQIVWIMPQALHWWPPPPWCWKFKMWQYLHIAGSLSESCLYSYIPRNCVAPSDSVPAASRFIIFFFLSVFWTGNCWILLEELVFSKVFHFWISRTIDRRKRLIIAMDAAFGMEYLHGKNIVHFDLKSHNFLVNMRDPHRPVCKAIYFIRILLFFIRISHLVCLSFVTKTQSI